MEQELRLCDRPHPRAAVSKTATRCSCCTCSSAPVLTHLHFSDNPQAVQEQDLCSGNGLEISVQRFAARSSVSSANASSLRLEVTDYHCSI